MLLCKLGRMGVSFITFGNVVRTPAGKLTSDTASARYRILLPGEQLVRRGHDVQVHTTSEEFWRSKLYAEIRNDVVVFSKSFDPRNEQLAVALQKTGRRIVVDICDNHFDHVKYGSHFRRMVDLADQLIVSTETMAEVVHSTVRREARVIGDPVEGRRGVPRFSPHQGKASVVWFGHPVNLDTVIAVLPELRAAAQQVAVHVDLVTAPVPGLARKIDEWNHFEHGALTFSLRPWSLAEVERRLDQCDLVMIPSLANDRKSVKSPNRLLEAIWAGRLAVAYPLPSYLDFEPFARIGSDIGQGILAVMNNPDTEEVRIAEGQRRIAERFLPFWIAGDWESALFARESARCVRVNVGCDGRPLRDHLNIMDPTMPNAAQADMVCNPVELGPIADSSVDELLITGAQRYLTQGNAATVLGEWTRVLKPGGTLAIEFERMDTLTLPVLARALEQQGLQSIREEVSRFGIPGGHASRISAGRRPGTATAFAGFGDRTGQLA